MEDNIKEVYLAGGCFWGLELYLKNIIGVTYTEVGYANGDTINPTYEEVCSSKTGFAETVHIKFNEEKISLNNLLWIFFNAIDPTSINKQGNDSGNQYRTGIYYKDIQDKVIILMAIKELSKKYDREIMIEVEPIESFYRAEEYHQTYLEKHPNGYCHINKEKIKNVNNMLKKEKEDLKHKLTTLQYNVVINNETEPPFKNEYYNNFKKGVYVDIVTGEPLFLSTDKFESGCGWPSFSRPLSPEVLLEKEDKKLFIKRTEVRSKIGNIHLGHVFDDGPKEKGGKRYCINSASLRFIPYEDMEKEGLEYLKKYII